MILPRLIRGGITLGEGIMRARIILIYLISIEARMTKVGDVIVNTTTVAVIVDIEKRERIKGDTDTRKTVKEGIGMRKKVKGGTDTKKMVKDDTGMKTKKRGAGATRAGVGTKKYLLSKLERKIIIQMRNSEDHKTETEKSRAIGAESQITQVSLTKVAQLSAEQLGNIIKKKIHL